MYRENVFFLQMSMNSIKWCSALQLQCVSSHHSNRIIFSWSVARHVFWTGFETPNSHSALHNEPVFLQQPSMSRMTGNTWLYSFASLPPSSAGVAHTWHTESSRSPTSKSLSPVIWHTPEAEQWGFHGGNSHINSGITSVWNLIIAHVTVRFKPSIISYCLHLW